MTEMQRAVFDRRYLEYYQDRLERASDGTRVPGMAIIAALVDELGVQPGQRVLDVGCSFGRLLPVLARLTDRVYGLELSYDVVDVAAKEDYLCVVRGSAEDSNLPSAYFSHLVLFGVFDCCQQAGALSECARLLVPGGRALITGKNANYADDDRPALIAERNAWRKAFPNSYTYASSLADVLPQFGLELVSMRRFERRGDFGEMRDLNPSAPREVPFYEFAAVVQALGQQPSGPRGESEPTPLVSTHVSHTAERAARIRGFPDPERFFASDVLDEGHG